MIKCSLKRRSDGKLIVNDCELANTMWLRMKGLLGRTHLPEDTALLIKPCNSIHTFFMKFPIDVAFLSKEQKILAVYNSLSPWRLSKIYWKADSVVEFSSGKLKSVGIRVGDILDLIPVGGINAS